MINLPTQKTKAKSVNPRFMVIFSKPKCGKSTACAALENNLCIDLENGYEHLDALKISANSVQDLSEIAAAISEENKRAGKYVYDHITLDTGTKLEEIAKTLALSLYNETPMGKNYRDDILKLPNGKQPLPF